ncbi:MAG: tRNA dimethylallyltransferase [Candidatus Saccharibacteria bacterium]|nr:tRNA dimethylallyltransferase [Candidatus Saccharibacteria bacterium]
MATTPLVVIVGETASGKSQLAIELSQRFNGEIIAADSWTVRREVNIGTAKPSLEDRLKVPHHLLDVAGPNEDFTAAVFKRLANQTIQAICGRGKLPIMVGGTGLYIDGVLYDFGFLPEGDRSARQALNVKSIQGLLVQAKQKGIDLTGIDVRNKRRIIRALETKGSRPTRGELRPNTLIIGLALPRETLQSRIEQRVDTMLKSGLEAEVKRLSETYGWECEALKGIGYAQWQAYFNGTQTLPQTRAAIIKATQDLAKRQRTWFKRNKSIHWITDTKAAIDLVEAFLNKLDAHD